MIEECLRRGRSPDRSGFLPYKLGLDTIGWIRRDRVSLATAWPAIFVLDDDSIRMPLDGHTYQQRSLILADTIHELARVGIVAGWRNEKFPLLSGFGCPALAEFERAAVHFLGARNTAVHLTAYVARGDDVRVWVSRRAETKTIDPGKYDNTASGGITAGEDIRASLEREAFEEAGLPTAMLSDVEYSGPIQCGFETPHGLFLSQAHCFDVAVGEEWSPVPQDGEVSAFELVHAEELLEFCCDPNRFCVDSALCTLEFLLRRHLLYNIAEPRRVAALARLHAPLPVETLNDEF